MKNLISFLIKILVINFFIGFSGAYADDVLKIYSERQPMLIEPLLNEFESQTGIDVEWIYSKKGLVQKIILEKDKPVADVFLASDISRLIDVSEAGASIKINYSSAVPSHLQSDNWIGLTQRARIIYVNKDLGLNDITYEDLVSEKYKGRICTRSGFHPYNVSLFASLMAHHGEEWLENYLINLKANLARKPQGNDRDQVKAIYAGVCDLSIGNHYYYFKMLNNEEQKIWLEKATIVFPNQKDRGTHVNISGIALLKESHREKSEKLLDFLVSQKAQGIYANDNNEFPVSPEVPLSVGVNKLAGGAKFDNIDLLKIAENRKAVVNILNKINYDE